MGILRTILHIITLGDVDSNEEVARKKAEEARRNTPFNFPYNMSETTFRNLAVSAAKPIKRLSVETEDQYVLGTVRTSSGINTWQFVVDFNDHGTLTGNCWMLGVENSDSQIPYSYAEQLSSLVKDYLQYNHQ